MSNVPGTVTDWKDEETTTIRFPADESPDGIPATAIAMVCVVVAAVTATAVICTVIVKCRKSSRVCLSRASSASYTCDNLQPETPSSLQAAIPREVVIEAAGQIHSDHTARAEATNMDLKQPHSSSDITLRIRSTTNIHVPSGHLTDRYIFRESGRAFSLISNRLYDFNSALRNDSCWDGRPGRQSDQCPPGLFSEVQHNVMVPYICSPYEAGFARTDHYTYLNALYRASEALSSLARESVIYDIAMCPGRASYAATQPDHYTYLDVLHCPVRPGSIGVAESVIYDIINDLEGSAGGTAGQYTHIYNVRRYSELHTRPLFPSGEYAIPFETTTRHSFGIDFLDAASHMYPDEASSLARYSSETNYYDTPSDMHPGEASSLARYSSETNYYDTPSDMHPGEASSLARYSSETNYYDTPSDMHPGEASLLARYSSEICHGDMPTHQ
ncbi:uncharacterized protein [Haliotis asinina]|uniref:uncharacterized protein n=1 Tax=Haliotis asinina TaxID=109174 RepID=UPI0035325351